MVEPHSVGADDKEGVTLAEFDTELLPEVSGLGLADVLRGGVGVGLVAGDVEGDVDCEAEEGREAELSSEELVVIVTVHAVVSVAMTLIVGLTLTEPLVEALKVPL